jgi:hypothetical protein
MRNGMVVVAALVLCWWIPMQADAEMRITPDGVTTPDDTASVRVSGSFTAAENPSQGAVISGENSFYSIGPEGFSCGGYFSATAVLGMGVFGRASAPYGRGVMGETSGRSAVGVWGEASGSSATAVYGIATSDGEDEENFGGWFKSEGGIGCGVVGEAFSSAGENYGGYFTSAGIKGKGVYAEATNDGGGSSNINYGGHFVAQGLKGRGVLGETSGANGIGVWGKATGDNSTGVWGEGVIWDFYANGSGRYGSVTAGGEYGPFTGAHEVIFSEDMPEPIVPGLIVSVTGRAETRKDKNGNISLSSTLPTVTLSTKAMDKTVFGVLVSQSPLPEGHWHEAQEGGRFGVVNALGEGRVWVTDINGQIRAGDYVTTSAIPGYGQMQDDDLLHSYTLGKAIETVDWDQVPETIHHEGKTYRRYLLAVVYTSG